MNKFITHSTSTAVLSSLLIMTGCSSDGGGGVAVPANAATIDATNAFALVQKASVAGFAIAEATENNSEAGQIAVCNPSGSSTTTVVENGDLFVTGSESAAGLVTLNDCGTFVSGVTDTYFIGGTLNFSESATFNLNTGDLTFTENISGNAISLKITDVTTPAEEVTVNSYVISVNGSEAIFSSGTYSATVQLSYDSSAGDGFAAQSTIALTGPTGFNDCPTGGVLLVTGAAGTQARGTFANDGNVLIEYHTGDGVWLADTTYACSNFES